MNDNSCHLAKSKRGVTLLEVMIALIIISVLGFVALRYYQKLLVDVERTKVRHDVGVMRSAIGMQVARYVVAGKKDRLADLVGSNPMDLLDELPDNYRGTFVGLAPEQLEPGGWYFEVGGGVLVYVVLNSEFCETALADPKRIEFKISLISSDSRETGHKEVGGVTLRESSPYRWLSPWD